MKKWLEWAFVALLIVLALTQGWLKQQQSANFADANIETNEG